MRVIFPVRHNFHEVKGGAYIQIIKSVEYLVKNGVDASITSDIRKVHIDNNTIIHFSDLTWVYDLYLDLRYVRSNYPQARCVLYTIYWPLEEFVQEGSPTPLRLVYRLFGYDGLERLKSVVKFITKKNARYLIGLMGYTRLQSYIVKNVELLLPNAYEEGRKLVQKFNVDRDKIKVVYNGVDLNVFKSSKPMRRVQNRIVCAGRIDARKNQLNLLKADIDENVEIIFVGSPGPNSKSYAEQVKSIGRRRGNVQFINHMDQEELFNLFRSSLVHVLVSWVETPGLVNLEAAYCGCRIVATDVGSVREYLGDNAYYCRPDDLESIRGAVECALNSNENASNGLKESIEVQYNWNQIALNLVSIYDGLEK